MSLICFRLFWSLLLFLLLNSFIRANTWAILPVISEGLYSKHIQYGPRLFLDKEKNHWEISQLIQNMLSIGGMKPVIRQDIIKRSYLKLRLNSKMSLNLVKLKDIARETDAAKLLISNLRYTGSQYILTSRVYYSSSHNLTDTIQTKATDVWQTIDKHLKERFHQYDLTKLFSIKEKQTVLFLLDASGSNFQEIKSLKKFISYYENMDIGICSVHGNGKLSFLKTRATKKNVMRFLSKLSPQGGGRFLKNTHAWLTCLEQKIFPRQVQKNQKIKIIIMASGIPKNEHDRRRTRLLLRRFSRVADILTIGSSNLNPTDRVFWADTMAEISDNNRNAYKDLLYRQTIGLANGNEVYVFKEGAQLIQSRFRNGYEQPDFTAEIPHEYWADLGPKNIAFLYEKLFRNQVISAGKPEILLEEIISAYLSTLKTRKKSKRYGVLKKKPIKILLKMEEGSFWISVPRRAIYDQWGNIQVKQGENYYFLLNMKPPAQGIPFKNDSDFGFIYHNASDVPKVLLLKLSAYLKNPKDYLDHSVGGSSLYIFFGQLARLHLKTH